MDESEIWDRWMFARAERPDIAPEDFAAYYGERAADVLALIRPLAGLADRRSLPALVDVLPRLDGADGEPFAGFVVEEHLGAGSTGIVFAARAPGADGTPGAGPRVALKILNPILAVSPERRDAVLREAEIAGKLEHPAIARVVASGVERGYAWIATEWVDGETLLGLLEMDDSELRGVVELMRRARGAGSPGAPVCAAVREWPIGAQAALEVGLQLVPALEHAHQRGVVHRDLKPANVLLSREGRLKVIDFGLASVEGTRLAVSSSGEWGGTPLYMAPEQFHGTSSIGPSADIHALGLILADVATGSISAPERMALGSFEALLRSARSALGDALRRLPRVLEAVVGRCTEFLPEDRYRSCSELRADLECASTGRPLEIGSMAWNVRVLRSVQRHPFRWSVTTAVILAGLLVLRISWTSIDTGRVHIATGFQGEPIWIDGASYGLAPKDVVLRSGRHRVDFRAWDEETLLCPPFEIDVPRGARTFETFVFRPTMNVHRDPPSSNAVFTDHAWLQVGTPVPQLHLWVDGIDRGERPGITALLLPLGAHHLRLEAPDQRPVERDVFLRDGRLCFVSAEFDPIDSPWTTYILYCPFDDLVRRGLRSARGVREYCETLPMAWYVPGNSVNKVYWAPMEDGQECEAVVALDVPYAMGAIEVEIGEPDITLNAMGQGAWSTLEMGPSYETMLPVYRISGGLPDPPRLTWSRESLERLPAQCEGRRELLLRFRTSIATVGVENASTCALRTNAMPQRSSDGTLTWQPALRIRVAERTR